MPPNRDENRISAVLRTTTQIVLSEMLTINIGSLRFSRRRVTCPRPLWTQVFAIKRVTTQEVEAAGIAPASQITQSFTPHDSCVNTPPPCLRTACTDFAARAGRVLAPPVGGCQGKDPGAIALEAQTLAR